MTSQSVLGLLVVAVVHLGAGAHCGGNRGLLGCFLDNSLAFDLGIDQHNQDVLNAVVLQEVKARLSQTEILIEAARSILAALPIFSDRNNVTWLALSV